MKSDLEHQENVRREGWPDVTSYPHEMYGYGKAPEPVEAIVEQIQALPTLEQRIELAKQNAAVLVDLTPGGDASGLSSKGTL